MRTLIDLWWRGGYNAATREVHDQLPVTLPVGFSWLYLLLQALFPFLSPHVWARRTVKDDTNYEDKTLMRAMAIKMNLLERERAKLRIKNKLRRDETVRSGVSGAALAFDEVPSVGASAPRLHDHNHQCASLLILRRAVGVRLESLSRFYRVPAVKVAPRLDPSTASLATLACAALPPLPNRICTHPYPSPSPNPRFEPLRPSFWCACWCTTSGW